MEYTFFLVKGKLTHKLLNSSTSMQLKLTGVP